MLDPGVSDVSDPGDVDALLHRLRWTTVDFGRRSVPAGAVQRIGGRGFPLHYVVAGAVELRRPGVESLALRAGDLVLLPHGGTADLHAGADTVLLGGALALDGAAAQVPRRVPPVVLVCGFATREPAFAALLDAMNTEVAGARPGSCPVLRRLGEVVAAAGVRAWVESGCGTSRDWIAALHDPHLSRVIDAVHDDPGSPWTVASLARVARTSRSQFADRFRTAVGDTPARYVARVRMEHAERMLSTGVPVAVVAQRLGYDSDAGFSRAFRRHAGTAPGSWRRERSGAA